MNFFTLREAAAAIAAEMHPDNEKNQAEVTRRYLAALDNAVATNAIVYRDPSTRLPLQRVGIAASMAAHNCVISEADLNAWLDGLGVGVQIVNHAAKTDQEADTGEEADAGTPASGSPTSARLAEVLGRYLVKGRDAGWLKKRLQSADRYSRLRKYRTFCFEGKRTIARWDVGAVVLHLMESGEMTRQQAKLALEEHYPEHLYVLPDEKPTATWLSGLS